MRHRRFFTSIGTFVDFFPTDASRYTDVASNVVVLDDMRPFETLEELRLGRIDESYLAALLHEATHHVTFDSPVGYALAALWASCAADPVSVVASGDEPARPLLDLATFKAVHGLLHPLIEGLALFVEHDVEVGSSNAISRPSIVSTRLFSRTRMAAVLNARPDADPWEIHNLLLRANRLTEAWCRQKRWLLTQGVSDDRPYLLGYLAIKSMYYDLSSRCRALSDPELFVLLLLDFFFHDSILAEDLLALPMKSDPHHPLVSTGLRIAGIVERFQDRMDELYAATEEHATSCVAKYAQTPADTPGTSEYVERQQREWSSLEFLAAVRMAPLQLNLVWPRVFDYRTEFRFSAAPARVEVSSNGHVIAREWESQRLIRECESAGIIEAGVYEGSVEAILLPDMQSVVIAVLVAGGLVSVFDVESGDWNSPKLVEHLARAPSFTAVEGAMFAFRERQYANPESTAAEMLLHYQREGISGASHLYWQLFCREPNIEKRRAAFDKLAANGFLGLIAQDDMELVARLSLLCGVRVTDISLAALAEDMAVDALRRRIDDINATAKAALGRRLFLAEGDSLLCRV